MKNIILARICTEELESIKSSLKWGIDNFVNQEFQEDLSHGRIEEISILHKRSPDILKKIYLELSTKHTSNIRSGNIETHSESKEINFTEEDIDIVLNVMLQTIYYSYCRRRQFSLEEDEYIALCNNIKILKNIRSALYKLSQEGT